MCWAMRERYLARGLLGLGSRERLQGYFWHVGEYDIGEYCCDGRHLRWDWGRIRHHDLHHLHTLATLLYPDVLYSTATVGTIARP